ncbi:MAG: transglycosylase domain-containing protein [Myxococcota bacterium]
MSFDEDDSEAETPRPGPPPRPRARSLVPPEDVELTPLPSKRRGPRFTRGAVLRPKRYGLLIMAAACGLVGGGGLATLILAGPWWDEAIEIADQHVALAVAHPGWSFPARVESAPTPMTAPPEVLIATAEALGYSERCIRGQKPGPGEFCRKTKEVSPRRGEALEPVVLGWLVGADGELREHLPLSEAPRHLVDAIIAAEDRDFRKHSGVSFSGILRASIKNLLDRGYTQGASTLTMQVVRAFNQHRERTALRKIREIVMAMAIDKHLGKDGVLQAYLDTPYLGQRGGNSISGFRAAARHYFGKDATELDLAEAATLAAILPSPGSLAPDRAPVTAKERRNYVLNAMAEMGYDVKAALAEPMRTVPPEKFLERYPAYLSTVRSALESALPPEVVRGAGLVVTAAIDVPAQELTERLLYERTRYLETLLPRAQKAQPLESAGILLDLKSGRARAIYGGDQASSTDYNRAIQSRRQGGSAFKPVVYAMAMSKLRPDGRPRYTPASVLPNLPKVFHTPHGDWRPRNVTGEYTETACLANALGWSMNIVTASLLEDLGGPKPLIEFARSVGFDTKRFPDELGLALGQAEVSPVEMVDFFATVARGGERIPPIVILSAIDARGTDRWPRPPLPELVLRPEAAALTRDLLRGVVDFGTGGAVRGAGDQGYGGPLMGKTGTTDEEKDVWFVGATPKNAAVVWIGYDRPASLGASASDLAAPLWGWWMNKLTAADGPPPAFPDKPKLNRRGICSITGKLPGPACHAIPASFLPGTEPKEACPGTHPPDPAFQPPQLVADANGEMKPLYESIWKKVAEKKAAEPPPPPPPHKKHKR